MKTITLDSFESSCPSSEIVVTYSIAKIAEIKSISYKGHMSDYELIFEKCFKYLEQEENIYWSCAEPLRLEDLRITLKGFVFPDFPNEKYPEPTEGGYTIIGDRQDFLYFYTSTDSYVGVLWSSSA
ncbi:MAG: hypothetical protein HRU15_07380 [Planctomycetes bacterium]|nr:hypothetical protein [Planctomycetota bacterium]